jgi:hypothetical protein
MVPFHLFDETLEERGQVGVILLVSSIWTQTQTPAVLVHEDVGILAGFWTQPSHFLPAVFQAILLLVSRNLRDESPALNPGSAVKLGENLDRRPQSGGPDARVWKGISILAVDFDALGSARFGANLS